MSDGTKIEWSDATANVINGCSLESPGCTNCYAMKQAHRTAVRQGLTVKTKGGMAWTGEVRFHEPALLKVLSWRKPRMIFWNAHGDMFHPSVPVEWIDRCFAAMALTPQHIHQVLTKRSARMQEYLSSEATIGRIANAVQPMRTDNRAVGPLPHLDGGARWWPLPNVWLGVSAEDQTRWDERVGDLRQTPAAIRWVSAEPLLGLIRDDFGMDGIDWIVAGGESGPGARPCHPDWARALRDQCGAAGAPFFWKQWGEWLPFNQCRTKEQREAVSRTTIQAKRTGNGKQTVFGAWSNGHKIYGTPGITPVQINAVGKKISGRLLDGRLHDALPGRAA